MNGKSQAEAVNVLRSTRGLVKILIQREEVMQSPRTPAIEVSWACVTVQALQRFLGQGKRREVRCMLAVKAGFHVEQDFLSP